MMDPRLKQAQDELTRVAECIHSLAEDPRAMQRLSQAPKDEFDGLREAIRQAQAGLSLISSALEQIAAQQARGDGRVPANPDGPL